MCGNNNFWKYIHRNEITILFVGAFVGSLGVFEGRQCEKNLYVDICLEKMVSRSQSFFFVVWLQTQPLVNYFSFSSNFTFEKALDFFWERFMQEFNFSPEVGRWERKFTFSFLTRANSVKDLQAINVYKTGSLEVCYSYCENHMSKRGPIRKYTSLHLSCIRAIYKCCLTYQVKSSIK